LYTQLSDPTAKSTVLAALIGLFGVIFASTYTEIASFYKDREQERQRLVQEQATGRRQKWELVFPMIRDYYNPWIQTSLYLSRHLRTLKNPVPEESVNRTLFYLGLFYTARLRDSIHAGGRPILTSVTDEEEVSEAYRDVERSLNWDGEETRDDVSFLQLLFWKSDKPDAPYVYSSFATDLAKRKNTRLVKIRDSLKLWLNQTNAQTASEKLERFQRLFSAAINRFYAGWAT
jgi:hypothetical protein